MKRSSSGNNFVRTRYSSLGNDLGMGIPPDEGWGVSQRNRGVHQDEYRTPAARARRRAKRAAKKMGVTLKSYLRRHGR